MDLDHLFAEGIDVPPPPDELEPKQLPSHGGVWLLLDEHDRPIQLGGCESLRRTVSFRLANPVEDEQRRARADLRAITRRIVWWPTHSQFETTYDYHRIARQLHRDDYMELVGFSPSWFVRVDLDAKVPRLTPTRKVFASDVTYFGPFVSRAGCSRYIEVLQELFSLCRCMEVLEQAPNGRRCAYAEMGKCPAPCDGTISLDAYRGMVAEAVDMVRDGPSAYAESAEREMHEASARREFEQAADAKRRMQDARTLTEGLYRFVTVMDRFHWLIVQRGPGRTKVKPFFVRGGWIDRGETVPLKELDQHVPGWIEAMGEPSPASGGDDATQRAEHVWLVSHFLFRSEKLPGLFVSAAGLPATEELVELVRETFTVKPRRKGQNEADAESAEPSAIDASQQGG